ncbi:6-carboxytetrahydropterin synthase QueD [Candidatus Peregrinibacteria bacterium RIFCSPLOWO2_01_FULL_39_12]|nr:MAG: 6-carboxytetrahydropterin synthase QueD [Candidatus Peregrinibacteria bacterium RIFCSPLOWO2_01_FULL_39_12]OGJ43313.1 MAG: 6-carboxytetrahydropterin synthase QueD [Candidatus Peregrinibacteria bacterium RIFCSPLOWO2_02_FULL_39_10]
MELSSTFHFAASHFLTQYHGKCEHMHGHNYKLIVTIEGEIKSNGMILDFKKIKEIVEEKILEKLDHTHLNNLIENPSAENIVVWIWENLKNSLPLKRLTLYETDDYFCQYEGK